MNVRGLLLAFFRPFHFDPEDFKRWRDRRFRAALRRQNRRNRTLYIDKAPDPKCVVPNMREPNNGRHR